MEALAVVIGGIIGAVVGGRLSDNFKDNMNLVFGCCAMGMGVSSIVLMQNMPAVIFSIIVGSAIGLAVHLGDMVNRAAMGLQSLVSRIVPYNGDLTADEFNSKLVTGFRIAGIKEFSIMDMIPAMILVMPVSAL